MKRAGASWDVVCVVALVLSILSVGGARAADTAGALGSYRDIVPCGPGVPVAGKTLTLAHLTIEFTNGTAYPLRTAFGEPVGVAFEGQGAYRYVTKDPQDLVTLESNIRTYSRNLVLVKDMVRDDFERLVLLYGQPIGDDVWGSIDTAPRQPAPEPVLRAFDKTRHLLDLSDLGFDHVVAESRHNDPAQQYLYAEFEGKVERVGYEFDQVRQNLENFFMFEQRPGIEYRWRKQLSSQGIGGSRVRLTSWSLDEVKLDVATQDNKVVRITSDLTFKFSQPGLRVLKLALINSRDPKSARWDSDKLALHVVRITGAEGRELSFSHRYHELMVDLGGKQAAGSARIHVETEGDILTGPGGYRYDNYVELSSVNWFPRAGLNRFTFELSMRTKKPFRPVSSGDTLSLSEDGDYFVLKARADSRVAHVALFAGKYQTHTLQSGAVTIRTHAYSFGREQDREQISALARDWLGVYEKMLGPYPHKELEVVEIPTFSFYGVSPSGVVLLTSRTFQPDNPEVREYLTHGTNVLIGHEIAHQWFGNMVWPAGSDDWLSESFAEYLAGVVMSFSKAADGVKVKGFPQIHSEWVANARMAEDKGTIEAANFIGGDVDYRYLLLYNRGPLVLHMLRTLVGHDRFLAICRLFLESNTGSSATTDDFVEATSKVVGQDMRWFFDEWIRQPGTPEIAVQHSVQTGGGFRLVGKVEQRGPYFKKIHIPFILEFPGGKKEVRLLFQEKPQQEFSFDLPAAPTKVLVDPANNNLARYR
ncbi:MAG: hypothetical protein KBD01_01980 [Acidobacteria bacterium]|nr:hypothetical protein [Acidobacteriota bacterium]